MYYSKYRLDTSDVIHFKYFNFVIEEFSKEIPNNKEKYLGNSETQRCVHSQDKYEASKSFNHSIHPKTLTLAK